MWIKAGNTLGRGVGVLPYIGHIGICCCNEYSFQAVYVWNSQWYKSRKFFFGSTKTWNTETETEMEYRIRERRFQAIDLKNNILAMTIK